MILYMVITNIPVDLVLIVLPGLKQKLECYDEDKVWYVNATHSRVQSSTFQPILNSYEIARFSKVITLPSN